MKEHRIEWYDCEEVVLRNMADAEVLIGDMDFEIGDHVVILHGAIEIGRWEIDTLNSERARQRSALDENRKVKRLFLADTSVASSCCMTSEDHIIKATVQNIREVLHSGGCCSSRLRRKGDLKKQIDQAFEDI